jgi:hypothetical protein
MIAPTTEGLEVQMTDLAEKEELLESSGYRYLFDRMMYVNRDTRRVFSFEFVEDHSKQEIQTLLDTLPTTEWVFYFNAPPSDEVRRELAEAFGE